MTLLSQEVDNDMHFLLSGHWFKKNAGLSLIPFWLEKETCVLHEFQLPQNHIEVANGVVTELWLTAHL